MIRLSALLLAVLTAGLAQTITQPGRDHDYPAAAPGPDGSVWLAATAIASF